MLTHLHSPPKLPARVVILGAAGFVAGAVERRLRAKAAPLLVLPRAALDLTNVNAADRLADYLRPDDAILFAAAKAPVKNEEMLIENIRMGATVCAALSKSPVKHVVYISSDAVYADTDQPLTENSCAQPVSLHGAMHLAREVMLSNLVSGSLCILRPTLIYGVDDPHNGYGPNKFCRSAAAGEEIVLFGNGEERRDHVWVEDVAEIVVRVLLHQSIGCLNIATGKVHSFRDIAEHVCLLSSREVTIKTGTRIGPMPHKGYRGFDPAATATAFSGFLYTAAETGLAAVVAQIIRKQLNERGKPASGTACFKKKCHGACNSQDT